MGGVRTVRARAVTVLAVAVMSAGCQAGPDPVTVREEPAVSSSTEPDSSPSAEPADKPSDGVVEETYSGTYLARTTVLEADDGPQLCLGGVRQSLPPQCGGPLVVGWSWDAVAHESAGGVRWGEYTVVGRYNPAGATGFAGTGTTFTLTEPATVLDRSTLPAPSEDDDTFATRCPAPEGGWRPVDPARATQETFERAAAVAAAQDGYAALWMDQNVPPDTPPEQQNDPKRLVLNVLTTGDVAEMESALREVWGGSLCVSMGLRTEAELLRVQQELNELPGLLTSSADGLSGRVEVTVVRATTQEQRRLDEQFGAGVVRLSGALRPTS